MRKLVLLASLLLLTAALVVAQQGQNPPPSDFGIGNQSLSPNSDNGSSPSVSPDQNQRMTGTTGSTSGDAYPNAAFAGYSGEATASTANTQGDTTAAESTNATAGRRGAHAAAPNPGKTTNSKKQKTNGNKTTTSAQPQSK